MSLAGDDREGLPTRQLPPRLRHANDVGALRPLNLRPVRIGGSGRATLMRILMTNACSFNCHYCPMRRDRDMPRTLLKPAELVRIFLAAVERGWCNGLFVTTGIPGRPVKVMDDLIEVLALLREKHRFAGYIHVKMVPARRRRRSSVSRSSPRACRSTSRRPAAIRSRASRRKRPRDGARVARASARSGERARRAARGKPRDGCARAASRG